MKRMFLAAPLSCVVLITGVALAESGSPARYSHEGKLLLPDYREWVFLTSGLNMSYDRPATNNYFENVYVNSAAYHGFLKAGTWPDKTVLLLELRAAETQVSINKDGKVQTDGVGLEAHVKDASHGGWAFYRFAKGAQEGTLIAKTENCYSCHEKNAAVDTTFVQFYPTLIELAKGKGTFKVTEH